MSYFYRNFPTTRQDSIGSESPGHTLYSQVTEAGAREACNFVQDSTRSHPNFDQRNYSTRAVRTWAIQRRRFNTLTEMCEREAVRLL